MTDRPQDRPQRRGRHHAETLREPGLAMRVSNDARRLSNQHDQLDEFYDMLIESLERGSLRGARVGFVRFHDAIEAHLTLEDRVFFPALRGLRPDLENELAALAREHAEMRMDLDHLHDLLVEGELDACLERVARLGITISGHEMREEALMSRIHGDAKGS